jgi:membrane dipeptidase
VTATEAPLTVDGLQINNWDRGVLEELRRGGVHAVNATCAVWEGPQETMAAIGNWLELERQNRDLVRLVATTDEIRQARAAGQVAVLLGFQNTSPFGDDYRLVEVFARLGVRIAQLTYNIQNLVGGSCYEPEDSGLTRFGKTVVGEMNRVGMLVDLSHVGERTSLDAVHASAAPVAITHANPSWFHDSPRNKSDHLIEAVAKRGGVIGCCLYPLTLAGGGDASLSEFCEMVVRLADSLGPEHVAIGSDCARNWGQEFVGWLRNGRWQPPGPPENAPRWPDWPDWFSGPEHFPVLTEGLQAAGLDDGDIAAVLGGNWLRLFDEIFPGVGS